MFAQQPQLQLQRCKTFIVLHSDGETIVLPLASRFRKWNQVGGAAQCPNSVGPSQTRWLCRFQRPALSGVRPYVHMPRSTAIPTRARNVMARSERLDCRRAESDDRGRPIDSSVSGHQDTSGRNASKRERMLGVAIAVSSASRPSARAGLALSGSGGSRPQLCPDMDIRPSLFGSRLSFGMLRIWQSSETAGWSARTHKPKQISPVSAPRVQIHIPLDVKRVTQRFFFFDVRKASCPPLHTFPDDLGERPGLHRHDKQKEPGLLPRL